MNKTNTRKALNPAYRKHKPLLKDVNKFVEVKGHGLLKDNGIIRYI